MLRLLFFLGPLFVTAQSVVSPTVDSALTALLMADIPSGAPGGALGIVRDGEIIYENYGGLADLDNQRPIGPDTRFNIASTAKQFTALCILQLAAGAKLSLEDDIRQYLPEWVNSRADTLTIRHLLTHTSGVRDVYNLWSLQGLTWWEEPLGNEDAFRLLLRQSDLNFPPGDRYAYSNSNYLLLTEIVARVSGQPFAAYAAQLFDDLGMPDTRFAVDRTQPAPNLARPYFSFDTWVTYPLLSELHGDGALFTTLPDQLRYEQLLQDPSSLPSDLAALLRRSQQLPRTGPPDYGYGIEHTSYRGETVRLHYGSTGAWKATFFRFPERNLSIFVANNSGKFFAADLARDAADLMLPENTATARYATVPKGTSNLPVDSLVGLYGVTQGFVMRIARGAGDSLTLQRYGRPTVDLVRVRPGIYRASTDTTFYQAFDRAEDGTIEITLFHPSHAPYTLAAFRGGTPMADPSKVSVGSWVNAETGVTLQFTAGPTPQVIVRGDTLPTESFGHGIYLTPGYVWLFGERDGRQGLYLFDDRLRWVRFVPE